MENRKIKTICICALILIIVLACFGAVKWSRAKRIESVQKYAETAGLKNILIESSEYDKGKLFVSSSNFRRMEWDILFSMHEEIMNVSGVEEVTYSEYTPDYGYLLYEINIDEDLIRCYGGAENIDYYGSWENGREHFTVSTSTIRKDLEERRTTSKDNSSGDELDAKICAVKAVKDSLKSPSTAEFCKYREMTATNLGGNMWKITGYVDAQNSSGSVLREYWIVTMTLTDSGFKDCTVTFD